MVLYFSDENGSMYSVFLDYDWLEEYTTRLGFSVGYFLETYNNKDIEDVIKALDCDNVPYTIQEEHSFSGFMD